MRLIRKGDETNDVLLFSRLRKILPIHRKALNPDILKKHQGERRHRHEAQKKFWENSLSIAII